jgi:hypothetical protein
MGRLAMRCLWRLSILALFRMACLDPATPRRLMSSRLRTCAVGIWLLLAACQSDESWVLPSGYEASFEKEVFPVLLRDCAFHTCHGAEGRFFRVWGPGRVRLENLGAFQAYDAKAMPPRVASPLEVNTSYQRAVAFIDKKNPRRSLLLRKPLAVGAGGAGHLGADNYGRNVYRTLDSQGYVTLSRWVFAVAAEK